MRHIQPVFVYFKIFLLMFFISNLTNIAFASASVEGSSKIKSEDARQNKAENYLISTLNKLKVYSVRYPLFPACIMIMIEDVTDGYIDIVLREKHDGLACKGDTTVAPTLDVYRVMNTKPMKIYWLDRVNGKYSPILESIDSIK